MFILTFFLYSFAIYPQEDLSNQIVVYTYDNTPEYILKEYLPCNQSCPNESKSKGYNDSDPQDYWITQAYQAEEEAQLIISTLQNTIPFISDPIMKRSIQDQLSLMGQ